jgi:hypothetical protein
MEGRPRIHIIGWWRARTEGRDDEEHERFLEGEIPFARYLQLTSAVLNFGIDVRVVFSSFLPYWSPADVCQVWCTYVELASSEAVGFDIAETKPLIREDVETASDFANGPRPTAFSSSAVWFGYETFLARISNGSQRWLLLMVIFLFSSKCTCIMSNRARVC